MSYVAIHAPHKFAVGDRVAFTRSFLRSTGQFTGEAPAMRATVEVIGPEISSAAGHVIQFVTDKGYRHSAIAANLVLVDRLHLEPA